MRTNPLRQAITSYRSAAKWLALALPLTALAASAQAPGYSAGAAEHQATPPQVQKQQTTAPQTQITEAKEEAPLTLHDGKKLQVKQIVLDGVKIEDQEALSKVISPYENRALSMSEITEASNKVTLYLRGEGYLVAKAYVPVQDASSGVLTLRVVLGHYGKFVIKNYSHISDRLAHKTFVEATKNDPEVRRESIERAMLLLREMPGASLPKISIEAGSTFGASDFIIKLDPAARVSGYLISDNQGTRYTGSKRLYGGASYNSLFHVADKFSVSAMTTEAQGVQNFRAAYSFPLAANGLRLELAASKTKYQLNGTYKALNATGLVDGMDTTLSYPIARSHAGNFDFSMNFARKWMRDDVLAQSVLNRRSATVGTISLQKLTYGHFLRRNAANTVSLSAVGGNIAPNAGAASGTPRGVFTRVNLSITESVAATKKLYVSGSLKMQKAGTNETLDSSEQFFLSGSSGVKSYTEGVSADNGYVFGLDARYSLPSVHQYKHSAGAFADNAASYANKKGSSLNDHIMVSDIGGSYNGNYKCFFAGVQLAQSVGSKAYSSEPSRTRFFFQTGITF